MLKSNASCMNGSITQTTDNFTGNKALYESVYKILYGYGLPTICACGFLGNLLNLLILAGKRVQHSLRKKERAANIGLIALAVADLSFCVTAFPSTFLPQDFTFSSKGFMLYYGQYCAAIISTFIMTSTWVTVAMSTERYLAICHPFRSRHIITLQRTKLAIVLVYIHSAIANIPLFWRYTIKTYKTCSNGTIYTIEPQILYGRSHIDHAYRAAWAVIGNFIPLALLLVFNVALLKEIHKSHAMRKKMKRNAGVVAQNTDASESSNRITMMLVAIVMMFFVLVAPSEILKHVAYQYGSNLGSNYTYLTIEVVTNVMQTINFSANFLLYCIINPLFRRNIKELLCFQYHQVEHTEFEVTVHDHCGSVRLAGVRASSIKTSPRSFSSATANTSLASV